LRRKIWQLIKLICSLFVVRGFSGKVTRCLLLVGIVEQSWNLTNILKLQVLKIICQIAGHSFRGTNYFHLISGYFYHISFSPSYLFLPVGEKRLGKVGKQEKRGI
jgi:hypothetical protein